MHKQIRKSLQEGKSMLDIANSHFGSFIRYERGFRSYRSMTMGQRSWQTKSEVLWGPPGSGKSKFAWEEGGPDAFWVSKPNGNRAFWDGYEGQDTVVLDEFYGWLPYGFMCRLLDRYPLRVETKGSSVPFLAKRIIITSNVDPVQWYKKGLRALRRRLTGDLGVVYFQDVDKDKEVYPLPADPAIFLINDPALQED